jgi:RHS repeat-associated protein
MNCVDTELSELCADVLTYSGANASWQTHNGADGDVPFDGNGNVMALVDTNGAVVAEYEYSPFGQCIKATGPMAAANPFRFSTQYYDQETGLIMYPRRPYSPTLGCFITRDPIAELGGANLYVFCLNNPISLFDLFGLTTVSEVLESFFSSSTEEKQWTMPEDDEYTKKMKEWTAVKEALDELKKKMQNDCETWAKNKKTDPSWQPGKTTPPAGEPNNSEGVWKDSPAGTDPNTASKAWDTYKKTGQIPPELWYAAVGSFGVYVTVDEIDCCNKKAKLNVWVYNKMSQKSFGLPNVIGYKLLTPGAQGMANQYMWWNWKEDYSWTNVSTPTGGGGTPSGGGGGW